MTLTEALNDARKAVAALGVLEAGAVTLGVLDNAQAGWVTAALGVVTSAIVYVTRNAGKVEALVKRA